MFPFYPVFFSAYNGKTSNSHGIMGLSAIKSGTFVWILKMYKLHSCKCSVSKSSQRCRHFALLYRKNKHHYENQFPHMAQRNQVGESRVNVLSRFNKISPLIRHRSVVGSGVPEYHMRYHFQFNTGPI